MEKTGRLGFVREMLTEKQGLSRDHPGNSSKEGTSQDIRSPGAPRFTMWAAKSIATLAAC